MPSARPEFRVRDFARALEGSEELSAWLEGRHPKHCKTARYWKDMNGSTCAFYRGILGMIFAKELESNVDEFKRRLRLAGYEH